MYSKSFKLKNQNFLKLCKLYIFVIAKAGNLKYYV